MQKRWIALAGLFGLFGKQSVSLKKRFESLLELPFEHLGKFVQQGFVGLDLLFKFADAPDQVFMLGCTRLILLQPLWNRSFVVAIKRVHGGTVSPVHGWNNPDQEADSELAG